MSEFYGKQHRALQQEFDTEKMANRVSEMIVLPEIPDEHRAFIERRDFFFLTTIDHRGYPTCSHKGGDVGCVKIVDNKTLAFASLDGNGMYLSMGNIALNGKVGMLFIDFETPHRVRVHGDARVSRDDPLLREFPGAELIVRVTLAEIFINCPRYIHRYQRVATSPYAPKADCPIRQAQWKRIDAMQDALPERDKDLATELGGIITMEEYGEMVLKGEG
ncbi:MAG: pyridoxamine 5'-phosphate oxidase family protein [Methylobacillus sp.]|jgi:predicted pyridoxine 5'-phosphate oxidase superfamily flavin-nucleotide-binding protein|nr:pyridoxamine 5'-phosphate oxidase family protein [Methylobacillus sp.]